MTADSPDLSRPILAGRALLGLLIFSASAGCAGPNYDAHRFIDPAHLPASVADTGCPDNRTLQVQRTDIDAVETISFHGGIGPMQCVVVTNVAGTVQAFVAPGGIVFPGAFINTLDMSSAFFEVLTHRKTTAYFTAILSYNGFGTTNTAARLSDLGDKMIAADGEQLAVRELNLTGQYGVKYTEYKLSYLHLADDTYLPVNVSSISPGATMARYSFRRILP